MINKTLLLIACLSMNFMVKAETMQGQPAPSFNLKDQNDQIHQLSDYSGQWLVLYFYPKDDTRGCTIEAKAFRDNYQTLKNMNAEVLGVSLDDAESHREFINKYELPFNLLVDDNKVMSRDYGVDGGAVFFSYAKRQTFIINPESMIAKHFEEVDPNTHYQQVYQALNELQSMYKPKKVKAKEVVLTQETETYRLYGKNWPEKTLKQVGIETALAEPEKYLDNKSVITGRITKVCQKQGCWMILAQGDSFVRVDFNDHAFLIPKDSSGEAKVVGHLIAKTLTDEQIAHYESEGAGDLPKVSYELIADSVKIMKVKASKAEATEVTESYVVYGKKWLAGELKSHEIAQILAEPDSFTNKTMVIKGRITKVCQKQGCWMILANGDVFSRVDFNDHAFLIPKDSKGEAEVWGKLVAKKLTPEQKEHFEAEGAGELPLNSYEIIADSVKIYL